MTKYFDLTIARLKFSILQLDEKTENEKIYAKR